MEATKKSRAYSMIAAICFLFTAIAFLIDEIIKDVFFYQPFWPIDITFDTVIYLVISLVFAALLLNGKKNFGFVIVSILSVLWRLYNIVANYPDASILVIVSFIGYACLFVLMLFNCIPSLHDNAKVIKYIWFVPSALIAVDVIISGIVFVITYLPLDGSYWYYLMYKWMLLGLVNVVSYFFIGLWLKTNYVEVKAPTAETNSAKVFNNQMINTPHDDITVGGADKIKVFKELLDAGIITQAEFDAKKKQFLGL